MFYGLKLTQGLLSAFLLNLFLMGKFRADVIRLLSVRLEVGPTVYAYTRIESLDHEQYGYIYRNPARSRSLEPRSYETDVEIHLSKS